ILQGRYTFRAELGTDKQLLDILKIGSSAGGARAKALIAWNPATNEVRSGQANVPEGFGHWLIKFDGVSDSQLGETKGYGRVEMAYHLMATAASINMTKCRLLEEQGRAHFMTERFDRAGNQKLHVQTYCAMAHVDYNMVGTYGYEGMFSAMRKLKLPYADHEQLFRRMVFNVLARNCDDHSKNFAFLMSKDGVWGLAPAYDICHAYRPGSTWVSQQSMSVNGKRTNIKRDDFLTVAKSAGIKKADQVLSDVSDVVSRWPSFANQAGVANDIMDSISSTLLSI
ncbi:MAG: HipA domain-containing protein, partial [Cytophagales bacterium]|nr:HipA domain-containing protein [Cytophagales bacterium]